MSTPATRAKWLAFAKTPDGKRVRHKWLKTTPKGIAYAKREVIACRLRRAKRRAEKKAACAECKERA